MKLSQIITSAIIFAMGAHASFVFHPSQSLFLDKFYGFSELSETDIVVIGVHDKVTYDEAAHPYSYGLFQSNDCVSGDIAWVKGEFSRRGLEFCMKGFRAGGCKDGDLTHRLDWTGE
jgi:hypothetical protein